MPRKVILFTGHLVDQPDRPRPRFPPSMEEAGSRAIVRALDGLGAGPSDLGLCSAAAGGDLLFAEACLARGTELDIRLPFEASEFRKRSVDPLGPSWHDRFISVTRDPKARIRIMPEELGPTPGDESPYDRCNRWMLDTAQAYEPERARVLALWDGQEGDGPGGTGDLVAAALAAGLPVTVLDTRKLFVHDEHCA